MKDPGKKPIKESLAGGVLTPSESAPITKLSDSPIVKEIREYMAEKLKDVELVKILEDGDVYHMDLRFKIESPNPQMQYTREEAKHRAYDIKRALEIDIMPKFNIPSFSIAGVRTVPGPDKSLAWCEFTISFIYANKGNIKPHYEALTREKKVRDLVEAALKKNIKESLGAKSLATIKQAVKRYMPNITPEGMKELIRSVEMDYEEGGVESLTVNDVVEIAQASLSDEQMGVIDSDLEEVKLHSKHNSSDEYNYQAIRNEVMSEFGYSDEDMEQDNIEDEVNREADYRFASKYGYDYIPEVKEDAIEEAPKPIATPKLAKFAFESAVTINEYYDNMDDFYSDDQESETNSELVKPALKQGKEMVRGVFGGWPRGLKITSIEFIETDSNNFSHANAYYLITVVGPQEVIAKLKAAKESGEI